MITGHRVTYFHSGLNSIIHCGSSFRVIAGVSHDHGRALITIRNILLASCSTFPLTVRKSRLLRFALTRHVDSGSKVTFNRIRDNRSPMILPALRRSFWHLRLLSLS